MSIDEQFETVLSHLEFLTPFFEQYEIGVMLVDREKNIRWVNRTVVRFGWCEQAIDKALASESVPIYSALCQNCPFKDVYEDKGHILHFSQTRNLFDKSDDKAYSLMSQTIYDDKGDAAFFLQFIRDVSEREAIFKEKANLQLMLMNVLDNTADAVITLNAQKDIHSWNRGAWQVFGYGKEEVRGKHIEVLIPEDDPSKQTFYESLQLLDEQGFVRNREMKMLTKDRRIIDVAVTQTAMQDRNGEPLGYSLVVRDISNIVTLEESLSSKIEQLEKLFQLDEIIRSARSLEEVYNAILVAVTAGSGLRFNRAFLFRVNPNTKRLTGVNAVGPSNLDEARTIYSEYAKNPMPLSELISQRLSKEQKKANAKLCKEVQRFDFPLNEKGNPLVKCLHDSRPYLFLRGGQENKALAGFLEQFQSTQFAGVPLVWLNQKLGVLVVDNFVTKREITMEDVQLLQSFSTRASSAIANIQLHEDLRAKVDELKNAYQQLSVSQKQVLKQERLAALGQMASKVAHEIRNPLVSIGGFARILKRAELNEKYTKYLNIISDEAARLEAILEDVLGYVKRSDDTLVPQDINEILSECNMIAAQKHENSGVTIIESFEKGLPMLPVHRHRMKQAFLNIILNAVEATGRGGEVRIHSERKGDEVLVLISDTGVGMSEEEMENLFQAFYTTKTRGVGLGLNVTHEIIESHDGGISAKSVKGEGTTFEIRLPMEKKEADHDELDKEKAARS